VVLVVVVVVVVVLLLVLTSWRPKRMDGRFRQGGTKTLDDVEGPRRQKEAMQSDQNMFEGDEVGAKWKVEMKLKFWGLSVKYLLTKLGWQGCGRYHSLKPPLEVKQKVGGYVCLTSGALCL
jgi:hypothetical protein